MTGNVHEVWVQSRIDSGWTHGEDLSEDEKDYDRKTSVETIKLILKLGFKITK